MSRVPRRGVSALLSFATLLYCEPISATIESGLDPRNALISKERGADVKFYHNDGQLSTRHLTDAAAQITDSYTYDAFGVTLAQTGSTPNNYLYTGEQLDPNVGHYYLRARYLHPESGRFTSRDPFMGMEQDPASLHLYLYVSADPANQVDPSGLSPLLELLSSQTIRALLIGMFAQAIFTFSAGVGGKNASQIVLEILLGGVLNLVGGPVAAVGAKFLVSWSTKLFVKLGFRMVLRLFEFLLVAGIRTVATTLSQYLLITIEGKKVDLFSLALMNLVAYGALGIFEKAAAAIVKLASLTPRKLKQLTKLFEQVLTSQGKNAVFLAESMASFYSNIGAAGVNSAIIRWLANDALSSFGVELVFNLTDNLLTTFTQTAAEFPSEPAK